MSGLGVCISDPDTGERYYASAECPERICARFAHPDNIVNQPELLAMITAYLSFPEMVRRRRVMHHADNATAIAALINGYSTKVDLAHMSNMYNFVVALLGVDHAWVEYVETHSNLADIPSQRNGAAA